MAALGSTSLARLKGVKTQTARRAGQLADYATKLGGDVGIAEFGGLRTAAQQAQLVKWRDDSVAAGGAHYAVAPVGRSAHQTGDAFDLVWRKVPNGMTLNTFQRMLADYAPSIGLKPGYYFHGGPPNAGSDPNHFENAVIAPDEVAPRVGAIDWQTLALMAGAALLTLALLLSLTRRG